MIKGSSPDGYGLIASSIERVKTMMAIELATRGVDGLEQLVQLAWLPQSTNWI